jgi:hypothetical protein
VAQPFGAGTFSIVGQDGEDADGDGVVDGDGDLVDDPADPVTLTVTAAVDGVTHTVRAVARSAAEATAGYPEELDFDERHVQHLQIATQISASSGLTVTSISAYVDGPPPKKVRYAIYSDSGGEPGDLMAQTPAASVTQNGFHWLEVDLEAPTSLTPGTYWLALTFEQNNQAYKYDLGVGQVRFRHHDAVSDGFLPSWGTSATMGQRTISIFATGASFEESVGGSGNTAGGSGSTGLRVTWSEPGG